MWVKLWTDQLIRRLALIVYLSQESDEKLRGLKIILPIFMIILEPFTLLVYHDWEQIRVIVQFKILHQGELIKVVFVLTQISHYIGELIVLAVKWVPT